MPSRFSYDRNLQGDVADVLAAMRVECYADCQLAMLDHTILALADMFGDGQPTFDGDAFARRSNAHHGRLPPLDLSTNQRRQGHERGQQHERVREHHP